jgi:hypothetical protein
MIRLILILLIISIKSVVAQPGPFGGYDMSFTIIDDKTNTIVDSKNKNFKVFPTHYLMPLLELSPTIYQVRNPPGLDIQMHLWDQCF